MNMQNIQNASTQETQESKKRHKKSSTQETQESKKKPKKGPKGSKTGEGKGRQPKPAGLKADGTPRKKFDRFDGVPEEEVEKMLLPDRLTHNLDIVIIGINPGLFAAYKGHHYAGPGNHFWKVLSLSGLVNEPLGSDDDIILNNYGIGLTTIVARTTRGSADLTKKEIKEGAEILNEKLKFYRPRIAVFNGKGIYEVYSGKKKFMFGKQPEKIDGTDVSIWVMPSSSARCAQLPRAADKVPFYAALKKFRDFLKGDLKELDDTEITFSNVILNNFSLKKVKVEATEYDPEAEVEATEYDPEAEDSTVNNLTFGDMQESEEPFPFLTTK
ncbi:unnamed protein product [Meganyctiphanes norvegica]|uniref:G/T mismatch-specific thymine DNA glycosylase n=1 Tax=Meganyctiphanes norvegica TaxID=48144 RepID=A0AAV2S6A9_MEGNR